ncbi:MAG TPA: hypothetical protein VFH70_03695 [Acidimicrobiales bacterium]|nr:hypothetical protein [Acidimicrobiales bacterium]
MQQLIARLKGRPPRGGRTRSRRALLASLVGLALLGPLAAPALATSNPTPRPPGSQDLTIHPLVSGEAGYANGTYAWTGYAYNDTGPSKNGSAGGQATYPSGEANAANLIQLQLTPTASGLKIRAILETLVNPKLPLLGVGLNTDDNPYTGAAAVPGGSWTTSGSLGLEDMVTVSTAGGTLLKWTGTGWSTVAHFPATIDPASNMMETTVPARLLPPMKGRWGAVGVLGLATPGDTWIDGSGAIYDLAFVHAENPCSEAVICTANLVTEIPGAVTGTSSGQWQDQRQAAILAGQLGAFNAEGVINFGELARHVTDMPDAESPGFHTLLYYSPLNLGEGEPSVSGFTGPTNLFAGPYQPYLVSIPQHLQTPSPLLIFLHGLSENHLSNAYMFETSSTSNLTTSGSGSFSVPAIVAFPLGRGTSYGYTGLGEQDVLDVSSDVTRRYDIDPNRVVLTGFSMGGIGAFRIGEDYPDRFVAVVAVAGEDSGATVPNVNTKGDLENLIDLPLRMQNGVIDPLVSAPLVAQTDLALDELGDVDYRDFEEAHRTHEIDPPLINCWYQKYLSQNRVINPSRVVYGIDPSNEYDDAATGLVLLHTGAYWVSGLISRSSVAASIDATTLADPVRTTVGAAVNTIGQNVTAGADDCGLNPAAQTDDAWIEHGVALSPRPKQSISNGMTLKIAGLSSVTLDLPRMGLSTAHQLGVEITGDGSSSIHLVGPWSNVNKVSISRDGALAGTLPVESGQVVLSGDFNGSHQYTITPE